MRLTSFSTDDIAQLANSTFVVGLPTDAPNIDPSNNIDEFGNILVPDNATTPTITVTMFLKQGGNSQLDEEGSALPHERCRMEGVVIPPLPLPDSIQTGFRMYGTVFGREGVFVLTRRIDDPFGVQDRLGSLISGTFTVRSSYGQGV